MIIDKSKINASVKGTDYENFLLDLNKKTSLNKDIEILFEKIYTDFNLRFQTMDKNIFLYQTSDEIITGFSSPLFFEQSTMDNMPEYNYLDMNCQDTYIHETGHMIDYYLVQRLINDDSENYSIHDSKLKDFIEQIIHYYENNEMPKSLVDFFINSNYYKITQTTKYMYEALSDIVTSFTKGKYFNNNYHNSMDIKNWNNNQFLIYGHNNSYYSKDNEPNIPVIIFELFANYISICLLPNKDAYDLLKEIKNDNGENLQDVMNNFIADTVRKL